MKYCIYTSELVETFSQLSNPRLEDTVETMENGFLFSISVLSKLTTRELGVECLDISKYL